MVNMAEIEVPLKKKTDLDTIKITILQFPTHLPVYYLSHHRSLRKKKKAPCKNRGDNRSQGQKANTDIAHGCSSAVPMV